MSTEFPAGLTVLLSSYSQKLLETFHLPLPGHILIHGPPVSLLKFIFPCNSFMQQNLTLHSSMKSVFSF